MITDGRTPLAQHCNVVAAMADRPRLITARSGVASPDDGRPMKDLILDMCEPGQDIDIKEINSAWPDKNTSSLAKAACDLIADGLLERVGRGVYRRISPRGINERE